MNDLIATFGMQLGAIAASAARTLLTILALFVPIWLLERRQGKDTARYARRTFAHDVAYTLFYDSGAFRVLGAAFVWGMLQDRLSFLQLGLFESLPVVVVGALYLILNDFVAYWLHRAEHAVPFLWQFHAVHHAPEETSFLTSSRVHPLPKLLWGTVDVLLLIVLGVPAPLWFPFKIVQVFLVSVQHAQLDWTYGPLYRVVVSPVFHRLHHSRHRRDFDRNYASFFSFWDHLFGTANPARTPPTAVGVEGLPPERTLGGQFFGPFARLLGMGPSPEAAGTPAPRTKEGGRRTEKSAEKTKRSTAGRA